MCGFQWYACLVAAPKPPVNTRWSSLGTEDDAIAGLVSAFGQVAGPVPAAETWIGDDAAVLRPPAGPLVLAVDAVVAGVHADLKLTGLDDLGFKALTASVSDLAAMGARPAYALVSLCLPRRSSAGTLERLQTGLAEASARWACPVVGGDLSTATDVVVSVTVAGTVEDQPGPMLRSGASPGDRLFVTGPLGGAAAGLRLLRARAASGAADPAEWSEGEVGRREALAIDAHRRPLARLLEGRVARHAGTGAAIDVSDGLGLDLHRLATASGVGFRLHHLPVDPAATADEAVGGGEDYELILATSRPDRLRMAFNEAGLREPIEIGECLADPEERTLDGEPLAPTGWQHPVAG
jgi:thiamine-monophosphate kinase